MLFRCTQNLGLGRLQHALQTTQEREGKNDTAILALFEIASQKVSNRPDEGGSLRKRSVIFNHERDVLLSALIAQYCCSRRRMVSRCSCMALYSSRIAW